MLGRKSRSATGQIDARAWLARLAAGAAAVLATVVLGTFVLAALSPLAPAPRLETGADWSFEALSPSQTPTILVPRLGSPLAEASLYKVTRSPGAKENLELVPVSLVPSGETGQFGFWTRLRLLKADGSSPLAYDGEYRLNLVSTLLVPALPLPRLDNVSQWHNWKTLATPRAMAPEGTTRLRYGEPLRIAWDSPLAALAVEASPSTAVRAWLDQSDPRVAYVALPEAIPGATYSLHVREARGANGAPLLAPVTLSVQLPALPQPDVAKARLEEGTRIVLPWNEPLARATYEITPAVESVLEIDAADPRLSRIVLKQPKQGQKYEVRITGAASASGAPMAGEPRTFAVTTPPPLSIVKLSPRGTEIGVKRDSAISIRFSEPIRDRAAAETAASFTPALSGRFEWPEPDLLRFVPASTLPPLTKISVRLAGDPGKLSGQSGAYLAQPYEYSFTTQPHKMIDVNLSSQRITLIEGGKAVFSAPVATGVRFAETPTGQFLVTLKWPTLRMRGTNPSGISYDIPNVPWVMQFLGDYTFHGAPWRSTFGFPQSNGCVSMETGVAKRVYDWTPIGTPVRIHY